jgi:Protein of unknown function (DUF3223)
MSRYSLNIGDKTFSSKSKALAFYKDILNSYDAGEELNKEDYTCVMDLIHRDYINEEVDYYQSENDDKEENNISLLVQKIREKIQDSEVETDEHISSIIVDYHPEFRSTKCFFLICGNEKHIFSYRLSLNGDLSDSQRFSNACRNLIAERLRNFKKQRFKNRPVKCAVTNEIVEWEECQIDHKAPLTFSVIVKSFIVSNKIDVSKVEYFCEVTKEQFADQELAERFDIFHKEMAVLRVLSTKENNKLSGGARIKPTKKDGTLI